MRLGAMMQGLDAAIAANGGDLDAPVTGFAIDNRKVAPGTVFGAFQGLRVNGEEYIADAVKAGAIAVVARPEAKVEGAIHIAHANPRRLFAQLAARFFTPFPDVTVAVTGTNGKTSTVELARQLWRMMGEKAASIGTLGVTTSVDQVSTGLTTPDIVTFLSNMSGLRREGITHAAFEASSHGLAQYRTEGLPVRAGAFTNLSRDHLDYHGDMDSYFDAKLRLFDEVVADDGAAVVWADDEWSAKVIERVTKRGLRLLSVGVQGQALRLTNRTPTQLGQTLEIEADGKTYKVNLPLIGAYQAANALTAAGLVIATGGDTCRDAGQLMAGFSRCAVGWSGRSSARQARRSMSIMPIHPTRCAPRSRRCAAYQRSADPAVRCGRRSRRRQARRWARPARNWPIM
jgi:UDP-N-acetylmuramoyl-L-alanyl-D-glutamate--2,6-diaminopimelate ligase